MDLNSVEAPAMDVTRSLLDDYAKENEGRNPLELYTIITVDITSTMRANKAILGIALLMNDLYHLGRADAIREIAEGSDNGRNSDK